MSGHGEAFCKCIRFWAPPVQECWRGTHVTDIVRLSHAISVRYCCSGFRYLDGMNAGSTSLILGAVAGEPGYHDAVGGACVVHLG